MIFNLFSGKLKCYICKIMYGKPQLCGLTYIFAMVHYIPPSVGANRLKNYILQ